MNLYDAIQILRLHNQYFRCPAHIPDDARPPLVDPSSLAEAIDTVCQALDEARHTSAQAQRQIDQLQADLRESDETASKMRHVLDITARALNAPLPEGAWPSWHDLPQRAALATRLADDAAESVICTEGQIERPGVWRITREVLDADRAYLSDCLQHLAWRRLAEVKADHDTGDVIVTFRGAGSETTPAQPAANSEETP